ncbi:MAG TPA: hypothetical protein PKA55_17840 [Rhodoblastus sp.]|nr:hypothetical protein [Rhodoblastus sp.]
MTRFRKILTAGLAALTLGATVAATTTPADAFGRRGFAAAPGWRGGPAWRGGPGWRGGYGYGYGWRRGWGGPGPWVAGAVGGLALGAIAAGAYNGYGYGCVANRPMYDSWGNFLGYQRVRVACY